MTNVFQSPLEVALGHHRAGRLPQAEQAYRQILGQNPNDPEATHLLGLLAHQAGHTVSGIELVERATVLKADPQFFSNLGELCRAAGQIERGIAACQRAITLAPNLAPAYVNLAALFQAANRLPDALAAAQRAAALTPQDGAAQRVLGNVLLGLGRLEESATATQLAVQYGPNDAEAWSNLGMLQMRRGQPELAMQAHFRAVQLQPQAVDMLNNLGQALAVNGRHAEAVGHLRRAVQLAPQRLEIQENLAACLEATNNFDECVAICKSLIERNPNNIGPYCIIGNALQWATRLEESEAYLRMGLARGPSPELHQILSVILTRLGRLPEAIQEIDAAIAMRPQWVEANFSKALILLFAGRYEEAWTYYEWRWQHPRMDRWRHKTDKAPWDGRPLEGQRILLYAEQGMGDTILFARYATEVAQRGGHVILEVQPGLLELARSVPGVKEVLERGQPVPAFDTHAALLSLPGIFKTGVHNVPNNGPYVSVPAAKVAEWGEIIGAADGKFKVGIVWEGGPFLRENFLRSASLAEFAPLAAVPGVRFYSLQKGPASRQVAQTPAGMDLVDLDARIRDFSDTAAAIANLDLVIAVDTAVIHVAAAMGRPVWNLVARNLSGHMWLTERPDTPWYPTMRICRQSKLGDWPSVMRSLTADLRKVVQQRSI